MTAMRTGRDRQLLVRVLEIALARLDQAVSGHSLAHQRARAVGGDQRAHRNAEHVVPAQVPHVRNARVEIRIRQAMLEFRIDLRLPQGNFDQRLIEPMPRDGVDDFARPPAIRLQCTGSVGLVNESAAHRHQRVLDLIEYAGQFERVDPAIGQRQIDRSARLAGLPSRVLPTLVERHSHAATREKDRKQRAGRTRPDDGD